MSARKADWLARQFDGKNVGHGHVLAIRAHLAALSELDDEDAIASVVREAASILGYEIDWQTRMVAKLVKPSAKPDNGR